MLVNEPFETLVKQDTEMVQEIRVSCVQEQSSSTLTEKSSINVASFISNYLDIGRRDAEACVRQL